uniref:Hemerythrin n=1 Tax=Chaetopterus variopedatus TaxID=34590 RepID=A0A1S6QCX1_CHAVR|nr:hemerythrin [Chaetopterus variopedatus]
MSMTPVNNTYGVPEPFIWNDSFAVFYENLDNEHKQLFQAVFALANENSEGSIKNLLDVTVNHFNDEEGMMVKNNYASYKDHKKMHDNFVAVLKSLKTSDVNEKILNWAKDWLVEHIKTTDFKYKGLLG